ncbi:MULTISPECIES: quinone oxidoreductase family protein [unclassified Nocardioides]|uniref:quinone oxidoreductase family protein n=1 Tax=unclassified Nocardioides TaxID=2615069 RepID=UPI003611C64C
MRAVRRISPGIVEVRDVEARTPAPGEVLVDVEYAGVNPFDAQVLRGEIGPDPAAELTLGAEASGRVDGRLVLVSGGVGAARDGTFAAQVVVPESSVHTLPQDADARAVATVGVAGKTAWRAVHQLARVTADDVVLVLGSAGGVGAFAAQLARNAGATVLAHTGSAGKADHLAGLGAEPVVGADPGAVVAAVRDRAVSVVLDPLGGDYVSSLLPVLAPGARVVTYGVLAGRTTTIDLGVLYGRGIQLHGTSGGTTSPQEAAGALTGALDAVVTGAVRVDHEALPLEDGPQAFARLAERSVLGKLLLRP